MNTKKWFLLFAILILCIPSGYSQAKDVIRKVVIDAGHGGNDPGAIGAKSKEKDITLKMALQVGKLIKESCPDVEVYYTRTTDVFVPLNGRCQFANNKHADLFISIHCNSTTNKTARGVETYVMGLHKSESNLAVARKENAAMLLESDYQDNYSGFNPNSPESYVIFSLYSSAYLDHSVKLAAKVQNNLVNCTHFPDRKVQQAGFWVLHGVAMPSILIELGFISNPDEEAVLNNKDSQKAMATAIVNAFVSYKGQIEGTATEEVQSADSKDEKDKPEKAKQDSTQTAAPAKPKEESKPKEETKPASTNKENTAGIHYKIQIYATKDNLSVTDKKFEGLSVSKHKDGDWWKYTVGDERKYSDAQKVQANVKEKFPDAFMVAYKDGVKIPVSEARKFE